jgi:carbamoyl-phosphate synthase large subunit
MDRNMCPRVLVTGVGGRSVGHQILQSLLLLGDRYSIVATDADSFSYGLYQVDNRYVVPRATDARYLDAIRALVQRERIDVILSGTEPEVAVLARCHRTLGCAVIVNPQAVLEICANKNRLADWLSANGFLSPRTAKGSEWKTLVDQTGFPVVGKPAENTGGSKGVQLLNSAAEIEQYLALCDAPEKALFQQYVGSGSDEYTVGVAISETGEVIDSIVLRRVLTGLSLGSTRHIDGRPYTLSTGYSQGVIIKHPRIQQVCEDLALKIGARGPLNIQCRYEGDDVYIFEVHPRFSGSTSIRAIAGFNEPDMLIRNQLLHESIPRQEYQTDVAAIRAFSNLLVPMSKLDGTPRL